MDFRSNRKKKGEKSLWEQMGRDTVEEQPIGKPSMFGKLREMVGSKTASEVAEEEAKKLRKKKLGY